MPAASTPHACCDGTPEELTPELAQVRHTAARVKRAKATSRRLRKFYKHLILARKRVKMNIRKNRNFCRRC